MRKQELEITISPTGEVSFTIKGVKGASCVDETKFLEQALGGDEAVLDRERTSEYYEETEGAFQTSYTGGEDSDD
jgi:hypothetical protein